MALSLDEISDLALLSSFLDLALAKLMSLWFAEDFRPMLGPDARAPICKSSAAMHDIFASSLITSMALVLRVR